MCSSPDFSTGSEPDPEVHEACSHVASSKRTGEEVKEAHRRRAHLTFAPSIEDKTKRAARQTPPRAGFSLYSGPDPRSGVLCHIAPRRRVNCTIGCVFQILEMKDTKVCTYCDKPGTTGDHVPPKCLFAEPRPALITVPACRKCNQRASLDDEYFRAVIAMEEKAGEHPEAKRIHATILRSFQKPKKKRFRRALLSRIREVDRISQAGIYLGRAHAYNVNLTRLTRVVERITRGLFLHHTGRRLPLHCEINAFSARGLSKKDSTAQQTMLELVALTRANQMYMIGNDVFCYRYAVSADQENSSVWVFVVYQGMSFISLTTDLAHPPGGASAS